MPNTLDIAATDWEVATPDCGDVPSKKDWEPLRALARKRARITLKQVWEHPEGAKRIYHAQFKRFCYRDYGPGMLSVIETPLGLSLCHTERERGETQRRQKGYYCISFRGGKVSLYQRRVVSPTLVRINHTLPFSLDLTAPIRGEYPEAKARFSKRLIKMLRSKARANGARLPAGDYDDLPTLLSDALFPALDAVKGQYKAFKGCEWKPTRSDRWLLRHMRCPAGQLVKRMTGYDSRVVKRLFWEAMKQTSVDGPAERAWEHKWSWVALLRTWLPVDYTQAILRAPQIAPWDSSFTDDPAKVRRFLKQWEPRRVVQTLTETVSFNYVIRDTLRMIDERKSGNLPLPDRRLSDVHAVHEWLVAERNRENERRREEWARQAALREQERLAAMTPEQRVAMEARQAEEQAREEKERAEALLPLPVEYGKDVDGKVVITPDGAVHTIVTPKTPEELDLWGSSMHNCIGAYARSIRNGHCQIFGVRTEPKEGAERRAIDWGIEVRAGEVSQFRGVCNVDAPADLRLVVEAVLREAKLLGDVPAALAGALATAEADVF